MATYVMTFRFTQQGIQQIKDSPGRVEAAKQTIQTMGGAVNVFYGVPGAAFDTLFILDAPDDEAMDRMGLAIVALGHVRTSTHRVFSEGAFSRIMAGLP